MSLGDLKSLLETLKNVRENRKSEEFVLQLMKVLIVDEAIRYFPYSDATGNQIDLVDGGKVTIGIGRNLSDRGISLKIAFLMLEEDIAVTLNSAYRIFPRVLFDSWSEARQIAVLSLIFNMGEGNERKGFRSFKNSIELMKRGEWSKVAENLQSSLWAKQVDPRKIPDKGRDYRICRLLRDEVFDPLYLA